MSLPNLHRRCEIVKKRSLCFHRHRPSLKVWQNRTQREAERLKKQSEMEARQDARREAKMGEEMKAIKEVRRQEPLLQAAMARLRRQMQDRRHRQQPGEQRYPLVLK